MSSFFAAVVDDEDEFVPVEFPPVPIPGFPGYTVVGCFTAVVVKFDPGLSGVAPVPFKLVLFPDVSVEKELFFVAA